MNKKAEKTIFEKIIDKELEADIIYEDDKIIAFNDIAPIAPTHILIVPKKKISSINDLEKEDKELMGEMFILAKELAKKYKINETGYRTVFNTNNDAGQTVFHIHLHLIGGRKLDWPPG
ncbi:MAG: histidine triad nucleotide-binding protein [Dehalococcoidia bacterium]|mgnify:FL=1|tara:strand:- start:243 stop:599 length:357 start_codon:yes stop_codon:yes gene_type:complete